jgi:hypothetical protein
MGLTGKGWDDEYLDTAPDFRDISSKVLCCVEGSSQGVERLGRLNMVRSIMTDDLVIKDYSFESGAEETLTLHAFDFDHLVEGWHLARKKASVGHAYGLLLTQQETEQIKELQEADPLTGVAESIVTPILERAEAAHIIPPSRFSPRVVRSAYCRVPEEGSVYAVSPFVIVRKMGWKQRHRVLIANLATERHFQKPASVGPLLGFVNSAPRTDEELQRFWDELGCRGKRLRKTIADLLESGTLVICQEPRMLTGQQVIDQATTSVSRPVYLPIVAAETLR